MHWIRRTAFILAVITISVLFGSGLAALMGNPSTPALAGSFRVPPTLTSTPFIVPTVTPRRATPTATPRPPRPTNAPARTQTPTATATLAPTSLPTLTATPAPTPLPALTQTPTVLQLTIGANLRSGPGTTQPILRVVPLGTAVLLLEESQTLEDGSLWVKVRVEETEGWMNRRLLR